MRSYVSVGQELVYGGGSDSLTPILVTSIEANVDRGLQSDPIVDEFRWSPTIVGKLGINGTLTASLRPLMLMSFLKLLFSEVVDKGGYYVCEISDPKSAEMRVSLKGMVKKYFGVGVLGWTFEFKSKQFAVSKIKWIARDYEDVEIEELEYGDEDPVLPYLCDVVIVREGRPEKSVSVKTLVVDVNVDIDGDWYTVDDYRLAGLSYKGPIEVSGSIQFAEMDDGEVKSVFYGNVEYGDLVNGNLVDDFVMNIVIKEMDGSQKMVISIPMVYGSIAMGMSKQSRQNTWKFKVIDGSPVVTVYK